MSAFTFEPGQFVRTRLPSHATVNQPYLILAVLSKFTHVDYYNVWVRDTSGREFSQCMDPDDWKGNYER